MYKLKILGYGGYYHNVRLSKQFSLRSISGRRFDCPFQDSSFNDVLWGLIYSNLRCDLSGLNIVDIGPMEGYYTLEAAKKGAFVTAIHPPHYVIERLTTLASYFDISDKIKIIKGYYPDVGIEEVSSADIIFCLGLLYHLDNLIEGLEPLVNSNNILVIEGIFFEDWERDGSGYVNGFDPVSHKENERICQQWLQDYLSNHNYKVNWLDDWQRFVEKPGNLRHPKTRKALIAKPR